MDVLNTIDLEEMKAGHVFYRFQCHEAYLNNLSHFIKTGLDNNQQVLIIESMRNLPKVQALIDKVISEEKKSSIRLVNNFEYYLAKGDFQTQTILHHFQKDLSTFNNPDSSIRTWAHVEWASSKPDADLLKEFETSADDVVMNAKLLSVCAYSNDHLSHDLNTVLEQVHNFVMTDETLLESSLYAK